jgi:hypothetical protein
MHHINVRNEARIRRAKFLRWLRKIHGWLGLWGAVLGLLFGVTGIVMNHRAIMAIPLKKIEKTVVQIELETPAINANELAITLAQRLDLEKLPPRIQTLPASTIIWNEQEVIQPEHWIISFDGMKRFAQAEYWVGNSTVEVKKFDSNLMATLTRLHMAIGVDAIWILIADTIAGSLILLSLSGLLLWSQLYGWRIISIFITFGASSFALSQLVGAL